jgi:hypothetical protein
MGTKISLFIPLYQKRGQNRVWAMIIHSGSSAKAVNKTAAILGWRGFTATNNFPACEGYTLFMKIAQPPVLFPRSEIVGAAYKTNGGPIAHRCTFHQALEYYSITPGF